MTCGSVSYGLWQQAGGAGLALLGIFATVAGLLGLKLHGSTGNLRKCSKPPKWYVSVAAWCVGQALQLSAVKLASEPILHVSAFDAACARFRMRAAIHDDRVGIRLRVLHVLCRAIGG